MQASFVLTDLATFTAELASVFRSAIEKANLTLSIDAPHLDVPTYVDRDMWEKVVLNLVSNAFKFTLAGAISVRLSKEDRQVRLAVQDTGSGIPDEELPRLFERFHRVEGAKGRTHEGTGIGLALVQELVKIHGGTVRVESEVGRGSTFTVTIPAGKDHLPARTGWRREGTHLHCRGLQRICRRSDTVAPGNGQGRCGDQIRSFGARHRERIAARTR